MIAVSRPVLFDVRVDPQENCYPMIPSGAAHDEMILSDAEKEPEVSEEGKMMVEDATSGRYRQGKTIQQGTRSSHTMLSPVDNEPGVLARVIGLFAGRGYNIESLTVAEIDRRRTLRESPW